MNVLLLIAAKPRCRLLPNASLALTILIAAVLRPQASQAGGATTEFIIQPVQPQTVPPSSYPPGTTIVGQQIILGSVPARVWLEIRVTNWYPDVLKTVQATISATDMEMDGGGYAGSAADCNGQPANGGDLTPALVPCQGTCLNDPSLVCGSNSDCRTCQGGTRNGLPCDGYWWSCPGGTCPSSGGRICSNPNCGTIGGPACLGQAVSNCVHFDGLHPSGIPAGYYCAPGFQNKCHPAWGAQGVACTAGIDLTTSLNFRFGFTCDPGEIPIDYHPTYIGTLVLDVPANARGSYKIDFQENQTFYQVDEPGVDLPIPSMRTAIITAPCGRCCSGYASGQIECVDHVGIGECPDTADQVFTADEICPGAGGPDCAECASDADCDDGIACTQNRCGPDHVCLYQPDDSLCDDGVFCNGAEICSAISNCRPSDPPCVYYECDEDADACRPGIPAVSHWGLLVLTLALLIAAKTRYARAARSS